jgi:hypothetical protein
MILGTCRFCLAENRVLHGIPAMCCGCLNADLALDADDIHTEIDRLIPFAETGEQWAHICALEAAYVEATGKQLR